MKTSPLHLAGKPIVRRALIWVAVLLLLYAGLGFFALPAIIKYEAEHQASDILHRQLSIGKVKVNPFTLAMSVHDLRLMEPQSDAVFSSFETLNIDLSSKSLLHLAPVLQEIRLTRPYVHLVRTDAHHYNIDDIIEMVANRPPSPQPARFSLNNIQVEDGRVEFNDKPVKTTHNVTEIKLGIPFISSLPADVNIFVEPLLSAKVNDSPLLLKSKAHPFADPRDAIVDLNLDDLDVTHYLGYLPFEQRAKIPSARLSTKLTASFRQVKGQTPALILSGDASMKALQVNELNGKPMLKVPELTVALGELDVFSGRFDITRIGIHGLQADVSRDRAGRLNLERLRPPSRPVATAIKGAQPTVNTHISLGELDIRDASVRFAEDMPQQSLRAGVEKFNLTARKIDFDLGKRKLAIAEVVSDSATAQVRQTRPEGQSTQTDDSTAETTADPKPESKQEVKQTPNKNSSDQINVSIAHVDVKNWSARVEDDSHADPAVIVVAPLSLSLRDLSTAPGARSKMALKATTNKTGQLAVNGTFGVAPLYADLSIDMKGVDLQPVQPYIADKVNLRLTQANASGKGKLQLDIGQDGTLKGGFKGDANLDNLAAVDHTSSNDFLRWKSLGFSGMDIKLQPLSIDIDRIALSDFFARVIIDPTGRINLQDIVRGSSGKSLTEAVDQHTSQAPSPSPKPSTPPTKATAKVADAAQTAAQRAVQKLPPVHINRVTLKGGRVRFTDNFIRPNYSADMRDLGGSITALSSDAATNANVDVHGVVNNAPLSIAGRINPLRRDLFLDVKGNVRGMELASLSAYSDKYIGYDIEKGRLSFEVSYVVDNRRLTANNRLILEQLTFGKESTNPSATKLPVRMAVALLADRNGVIDVNVPIEGSLDDPQFSVGGIILQVIGNLIVKAVTAPFTLLSSSSGGGQELSTVEFDPGRAMITTAAEGKLKSLAKALNDRPGLKLDITGRYDPATDIEGLKLAMIERKVRALKIKDMRAHGEAMPDEGVTISKEEYPALLTRVYKDESFDKPRNVIGMQKKLPVEEMQSLMLANTTISNEDLVTLGNRRAQAAKDWLTQKGGVPADRVFIVAAKAKDDGETKQAADKGEAKDNKAKITPSFSRVDFALHS